MPLPSKVPLTDDEKYQQQLLLEQDLQAVQRQYAQLERDRTNFSQAKLSKQNRVLSIFQREHREILSDLKVAQAPIKIRENHRDFNHLQHILQDYDRFSEDVTKNKIYISEIAQEIQHVHSDVLHLRKQQTSDRQHEERVVQAQQTCAALDNKLEVQVKKFGTLCAENRSMRYEINHLMQDRMVFMKFWDQMIVKLNKGKSYMYDLIEQANLAYDQREEWCSRLYALRLTAHNDLQMSRIKMAEYTIRQDNHKKLEEFHSMKNRKRVLNNLVKKKEEKRKLIRAELSEKHQQYQQYLNEVFDFCQEKRVIAVVNSFCEQEYRNFQVFQRINDQIAEMEKFGVDLTRFHLEIEEQEVIIAQRQKLQDEKLLQMEEEMEKKEMEVKQSQDDLEKTQNTLLELLKGIDTLFQLTGCENDPLLQLLGDNFTIHNYNVLLYLEILEKRVMEVMLKTNYADSILLETKKISAAQKSLIFTKVEVVDIVKMTDVVETNPCPLCVEREMVSDVIDSVQHVLTRAGAEEKLKNYVMKQHNLQGRLHNVSNCHLPKSRAILQKRYT